MKTHTTSDYSIFKFLRQNREVGRPLVRRLAQSLALSNLLHTNPILVTPQMEIIDGQHRLEACKILKIPVVYAVDDNYKAEHMLARQEAKPWQLKDRVRFHACEHPDWDRLQRARTTTGAPYKVLLALLGYTGKAVSKKLLEGGYLADGDRWMQVEERGAQVAEIQRWLYDHTALRHHRFYREWKFAKAVCNLLDSGLDFDKLLHKIQVNHFDLKYEKSVEEYEALLRRIYKKRDRT